MGATVDTFSSFDSAAILKRVDEGTYTVLMAVPTIYVKIITPFESLSSEEQRYPIIKGFADMRLMVSGSAALPASVLHKKWTNLTVQKNFWSATA